MTKLLLTQHCLLLIGVPCWGTLLGVPCSGTLLGYLFGAPLWSTQNWAPKMGYLNRLGYPIATHTNYFHPNSPPHTQLPPPPP